MGWGDWLVIAIEGDCFADLVDGHTRGEGSTGEHGSRVAVVVGGWDKPNKR